MKWLIGAIFVLGAHFGASYIIPLDSKSQGAFGGLLKWFWPWAEGNHGPLGVITVGNVPVPGFFIAVTASGFFILAALAIVGIWVPFNWWRICSAVGAILLLLVTALFFGPTKIIPIAYGLFIVWAAWNNWEPIASIR